MKSHPKFKCALVISAISAVFVLAPVSVDLDLGTVTYKAAYAKDGNGGNGGNGGGGGNGNGGDNGRGNSGDHSNSGGTKGNSANSEKENRAKNEEREKIQASLGGLNSLNRNINGMLNSSDPRLSGFQEWYTAEYCSDGCPDPKAEGNPTSQQLIETYLNSEYETEANTADGSTKVFDWIGDHAESVGESLEDGVNKLKSLFSSDK